MYDENKAIFGEISDWKLMLLMSLTNPLQILLFDQFMFSYQTMYALLILWAGNETKSTGPIKGRSSTAVLDPAQDGTTINRMVYICNYMVCNNTSTCQPALASRYDCPGR